MSTAAPFSPSLSEYVQRHRVDEDVRRLVDHEVDDLSSHYSMVSQDADQPGTTREAAAVYLEADESFQLGNFHQAAEAAFQALAAFQSLGDKKGIQDATRLSQAARSASGAPAQAREEAQEMLEKMKEAGDKRGQGCMLLGILECSAAMGEFEQSMPLVGEALELLEGDNEMIILAHLRSSKVWSMGGEYRKAVQAAEDALMLAKANKLPTLEARAHLAHAVARLDADQYAQALESAKAAVELGKASLPSKLAVAALVIEVDCHLLMEKPRLACLSAQEALDLCKRLEYTWGEAVALDALVYALMECGETNRAKKVTEASLKRFEAKADLRGQACCQAALAHIYAETHDVVAAIEAAAEEASIVGGVHGSSRQQAVNMLVQSYIYYLQKDGMQARTAAQSAASAFEAMMDKKGTGLALYAECFALLLDSKVSEALTVAENAIEVFKECGDKRWEARSKWAVAMANIVKLDHKAALDEVSQARDIFEGLGDKKMTATALTMMCDVQLEAGDFEEANLSAEEAIDIFKELGYKRGEAAALTRQALGCLKKMTPDPQEAILLLTEAKKLCKSIMDKQGEANVSLMMSTAHLELVSKADQSLAKSAPGSAQMAKFRKELSRSNRQANSAAKVVNSIAKFTGDKQQLGLSLMHTASSRAVQGRMPEALKAAAKAEKIFKVIGDQALQAHAMMLQAELQMAEAEPKKLQIERVVTRALELARSSGDIQAEDRGLLLLQRIMGSSAAMAPVEEEEEEVVGAASSVAVQEKKSAFTIEYITQIVQASVEATLAGEGEDVTLDSPLMESGMDSLSSVAFRNGLMGQLGGVSLVASLMFDYPSQRQIIDYIMEQSAA
mmetsp:Transcript_23719/g.54790  ORF Transcript_23719/g.54790 Transcript_23719/m.54790 type:complete len:847 (-) Transcript_23719:27-2567(-)